MFDTWWCPWTYMTSLSAHFPCFSPFWWLFWTSIDHLWNNTHTYTSRRIFHRPMISQKRRSCASQTHILGPKKILKKSSSQDAFVNPSSILWSKTCRVRFSFFQLTALPGRGPFWPAGIISIYLYMCIISIYMCPYVYMNIHITYSDRNIGVCLHM